MQTAEQFILSHAKTPYDPVKAHQYYIQNRQLKGRRKGSVIPPRLSGDLAKENTGTVALHPGVFQPKGTPKAALITTERQAQVQVRVKALQAKLSILGAILKQLVADANGTSTKKTTRTTKGISSKAKGSSSAGSNRKPLTATQKRDAAKKQKVRYKKTHPNAGVTKSQERQRQIKEVKQKIEQVRNELKAAIANARHLAANSQPAATGRRNSQKG